MGTADSVGSLLGFTKKILPADQRHVSDLPVSILKVSALKIECNLTTGAYFNGQNQEKLYTYPNFARVLTYYSFESLTKTETWYIFVEKS